MVAGTKGWVAEGLRRRIGLEGEQWGAEGSGGEGRYGTLERMASSMGVCEAIVESCRRAKASADLRSIKTVQDSAVDTNQSSKMAEQVVSSQKFSVAVLCSCSKGIYSRRAVHPYSTVPYLRERRSAAINHPPTRPSRWLQFAQPSGIPCSIIAHRLTTFFSSFSSSSKCSVQDTKFRPSSFEKPLPASPPPPPPPPAPPSCPSSSSHVTYRCSQEWPLHSPTCPFSKHSRPTTRNPPSSCILRRVGASHMGSC